MNEILSWIEIAPSSMQNLMPCFIEDMAFGRNLQHDYVMNGAVSDRDARGEIVVGNLILQA